MMHGTASPALASRSYLARRGEILDYFDRSATETWAKLTSEAPVGRIRATVREGRARMRALLLDWLGPDLRGLEILDAGCGTGLLAVELAARGAAVTAVDLSPRLVALARERAAGLDLPGRITFRTGDMLDPALGRFDRVVAMDSLIHYATEDMVRALAGLAARSAGAILFTFPPRTPALALFHAVGRLFPKRERAPSIVPVGERSLRRALAAEPGLAGWRPGRTARVAHGFYTSQALELLPA
jgi:magnesium-protoporphyrin O-methyltransferase